MTTWKYTASSQEVVRSDGVLIARDVPPEFGKLMEAAPELMTVLQSLVARWEEYRASDANQEQAYYKLAKYAYADWDKAIAAIARARP